MREFKYFGSRALNGIMLFLTIPLIFYLFDFIKSSYFSNGGYGFLILINMLPYLFFGLIILLINKITAILIKVTGIVKPIIATSEYIEIPHNYYWSKKQRVQIYFKDIQSFQIDNGLESGFDGIRIQFVDSEGNHSGAMLQKSFFENIDAFNEFCEFVKSKRVS